VQNLLIDETTREPPTTSSACMTTRAEIIAFNKVMLTEAPGIVWISKSGHKARVPSVRECPGCKAQYRLMGGKAEEHKCRILHCKKCPNHFCWFCMEFGANYGSFACVQRSGVFELCLSPVKANR